MYENPNEIQREEQDDAGEREEWIKALVILTDWNTNVFKCIIPFPTLSR